MQLALLQESPFFPQVPISDSIFHLFIGVGLCWQFWGPGDLLECFGAAFSCPGGCLSGKMLHPPYVSHQLWPPPQHPVKTLPRWSHGNLPPWLWGSRKYQLNHGNDMNCSSYPVSVFVVIDLIEFQNLICGKQRLLLYFYFATRIPSYSYATSLTFHFFAVRQMA